MTDDLLTAEQFAKKLGVSSDWVYRSARTGQIPSVRLGRRVRFLSSDVDLVVAALRSGGELLTARAERKRQSSTRS